MNRRARFGTTISMIAVAAVLSGCATGQSRESIFGSKVDRSNIGLATRAQAALAKGELASAVELAERAVENAPNDAGFRALLGNVYFASGRFASAEAAYTDSLALIPQPELVLKLALVQIAQGKNAEALAALAAARGVLDPANYGLAVALAGRPDDAVAVLNQVARAPGADARVRQNLALAYALSGDWTAARTVAAQDIPPAELDSRIQQWMAMATPSRPSDQVAALTGVTPAADPGQPQRLALKRAPADNRAYAYAAARQAQPQPQQFEAPAAPPPALPEPMVADEAAPAPAAAEAPPPTLDVPPAPVAVAAPPPPPLFDESEPVVAAAVQSLIEPLPEIKADEPMPQPQPEKAVVAEANIAPAAAEAPVDVAVVPAAVAEPVPELPTRFDAPVQPASLVAAAEATADEPQASGRSNSVVQLGAYSSPERVTLAWERLAEKYPALREYTPMSARFDGPKGTVWRLSVKGFVSQKDAISSCRSLKSRGGTCFVRRIAGDAPVQIASR